MYENGCNEILTTEIQAVSFGSAGLNAYVIKLKKTPGTLIRRSELKMVISI